MKLGVLAKRGLLAILALVIAVAFSGLPLAQTDDPCQAEREAVKAASDYLKELQEDYDVGGAGSHYVNPDIIQAQRDLANASAALRECLEANGIDS